VVEVDTISLADVVLTSQERFGLKPDYIHLDIQGAELEALKGLGSEIAGFKVIYTEVAIKEVYSNQPLLNELDLYLANFSFKRVFTRMVPFEKWGDAVYLSTEARAKFGWRERLGIFQLNIRYKYQNFKWAIAMKRSSRDARRQQ
jgi:hypothetical protein